MRIAVQGVPTVEEHPDVPGRRVIRVTLSDAPDFKWWTNCNMAARENIHSGIGSAWADEEDDAAALFDVRAQDLPGGDYRPLFDHIGKVVEATNVRCDLFK